MSYDWEIDAKLSYLEALKALRQRGLIDGKYEPRNHEEREWLQSQARRHEE